MNIRRNRINSITGFCSSASRTWSNTRSIARQYLWNLLDLFVVLVSLPRPELSIDIFDTFDSRAQWRGWCDVMGLRLTACLAKFFSRVTMEGLMVAFTCAGRICRRQLMTRPRCEVGSDCAGCLAQQTHGVA